MICNEIHIDSFDIYLVTMIVILILRCSYYTLFPVALRRIMHLTSPKYRYNDFRYGALTEVSDLV